MPQNDRLPLKANSSGQGLLLAAIALLALGVIMVHSATTTLGRTPPWYMRREMRHTIFAAIAVLVLLTAWRIDYRVLTFGKRLPIIPTIMLLLSIALGILAFIPPFGREVGGFHRWVRFGPESYGIGFQPSELIKLSLMVFLAAWFVRPGADIRSWRTLVPAIVVTLLSLSMIVTEDFGTAIVIGFGAGVTMILAGMPIAYILGLLIPAAGGFYFLVVRVPHRWARIMAMMDPWSTTLAGTYQPRQSLVGILTGGWTGKGPGAGMQKMFLPESSTDFIFSVYCEEWGFVGAVLLIALVGLWVWTSRRAAVRAADPFGRLLAGSLGFLVALHAILHIAVDLVAIPPTGMSFPFISAGGTSLVITALGAAIMVSVTARSPDKLADSPVDLAPPMT